MLATSVNQVKMVNLEKCQVGCAQKAQEAKYARIRAQLGELAGSSSINTCEGSVETA